MTTSTQEEIEQRTSEIHKIFYALNNIVTSYDPISHRITVEEKIGEILKNRTGWTLNSKGHFTYLNEMSVFIDPVTPPNTWGLISETAKRVLHIELEESLNGSSLDKTAEIQKAVDRLINEYCWDIVFSRKKLT